MQYKIKNSLEYKPSNTVNNWEQGMSGARIIKALNKWTLDVFPNEYHRFNNIDDDDLKIIFEACNVKIDQKLFRKQELKTIKMNIKI